jgi:hypothetical protein
LAGFFPSVGGLPITSFAHNIFVGMDDGTIRYLVRGDTPDSWTDQGLVNIGSGRRLVGLASYVSDRDGYGHVIAACDDGDVLDVRVSPDASTIDPTFLDVRANIPRPIAVAAYFGPSVAGDNYHPKGSGAPRPPSHHHHPDL